MIIIGGLLLESLRIDRLKKRWLARSLFLLLFVSTVLFQLFPPGDTNIDPLYDWAEATSVTLQTGDTTLLASPPLTWGHLIYFGASVLLLLFYLALMSYYAHLFVSSESGHPFGKATISFLARLVLLVGFLCICLLIMLVLSPVMLLVIILLGTTCFFTPILITYDKNGILKGMADSFVKTRGLKFSIGLNMFVLVNIYLLMQYLYLFFFSRSEEAMSLLHGFATAFFILACGRMMGALYMRLPELRERIQSQISFRA